MPAIVVLLLAQKPYFREDHFSGGGPKHCTIRYQAVRDYADAEEKKAFVSGTKLSERSMEVIVPDDDGNWINLAQSDWGHLPAVISRDAKAGKRGPQARAIFRQFGNGINTARDEWVTDLSEATLLEKVAAGLATYAAADPQAEEFPTSFKWSRNLKAKRKAGRTELVDGSYIRRYGYRPFFVTNGYLSPLLIDEMGYEVLQRSDDNTHIALPAAGVFRCLASKYPVDFHFVGDARVVSRYRYDKDGAKVDNVTAWAVTEFNSHYKTTGTAERITTDDIFNYTYACLHDPVYREQYARNLARQLPRIPFHSVFREWAEWGRQLIHLHADFENQAEYPLSRIDAEDHRARGAGLTPKSVMRANPTAGTIEIDTETVLADIPSAAWEYRLGSRSALEWVLEQHKEWTPSDAALRPLHTYRVANHKEQIVSLLAKVTTVSVETVAITARMAKAERADATDET